MREPDGAGPPLDLLVVGAGLAGLTAARTARRAGRRVVVVERSASIGGRTRTERLEDGTLFDAGFQVLFPAYPAYRRQFGRDGPELLPVPPSAVLMDGRGPVERIGDPLRDRVLWRSVPGWTAL
ncbi:MAG: FAD-dependent oxidoreductase, partial [Trueperaceae bacterium]